MPDQLRSGRELAADEQRQFGPGSQRLPAEGRSQRSHPQGTPRRPWHARGARDPGPTRAPGERGAQGLQGAQGVQGAPGTARAFGLVNDVGQLSRSTGVTNVDIPSVGVFCLTLAHGIDTGQTDLVATPDSDDDSTKFGDNVDQTFVEWVSGAEDCRTGDVEVRTGIRSISRLAYDRSRPAGAPTPMCGRSPPSR